MIKYADRDSLLGFFKYMNKALILKNKKDYAVAVGYFKKSIDHAKQFQLNPYYLSASYGELAKLYKQAGQTDSAFHYFRLNAQFADKNNMKSILIESLKALGRLYEQQGNKSFSLEYKSRYLALSDSLLNTYDFNKMKNAQFVYEIDKNYLTITSLTAEKERKDIQIHTQKKILAIISVGLIIFIFLLIMVHLQKSKLSHAYKDLFKRNNEILQTEQQNKELKTFYENKLVRERKQYQILAEQVKSDVSSAATSYPSLKNDDPEEIKLYSANKLTNKQKENLLHDINKVMEETKEFCECDFSLERLASLIGSNSRYVSLIINETYGKNFRTFVNEYRIKEARLRLMNTEQYGNYTIQAIAESVGYKSNGTFIDVFKKLTGLSPSIYKKQSKEEE